MTAFTESASCASDSTAGTPGDGFSQTLRVLTAELRSMGTSRLGLADIDTRLVRFGQMEDETMITEEQYRSFDPGQRMVFDEFLSEYHRQRATVREAHNQPGVIEDAFSELESAWRGRNPGKIPSRARVLVVLARPPDEGLLAIATAALRTRPAGSLRARTSRATLLTCETWFYETLRHQLDDCHVGAPLGCRSEDEYDAVLSLWDDDPSSEFHRLESVVDAVRNLG